MQSGSLTSSDGPIRKRHIPNAIYEEGMKQFPKRCKNCHRVFYDFSDWFIDHALGVPMPFKSSSLIFFRACQCHNTLAVSVDFGACLKKYQEEYKDDKIIDLGYFRSIFVSEISLWKRETSKLTNNRSIMVNVSDQSLMKRILGFSPSALIEKESGNMHTIEISPFENIDMYVCEKINEYKKFRETLEQTPSSLLACGVFYFTRENAHDVFKVIQEIKTIDQNFQIVTVSEEIKSVSEFGFDDNFHFAFNDKTEAVPFLIVNRLNRYFYMQ